MKYQALRYRVCVGVMSLLALPALAVLPHRDLMVELRQVEEGELNGYSVSTQSRTPLLVEQHVQVRNGEKASLSVGMSMPMQWVQSVSAQNSSLTASGASASSSGGAVNNAVTWMEAGQSIKVQPSWPGAKQLVTVAVEVQSVSVEARFGTELPNESHSQMITTVSAPIGQWVTIATTGSRPQPGVYGSEASSETRRLLQIRVLAP